MWNTLGSPTPEIRHTGAQAVAKIAGAEIPAKQWPDLVTGLQSNVANAARPRACAKRRSRRWGTSARRSTRIT